MSLRADHAFVSWETNAMNMRFATALLARPSWEGRGFGNFPGPIEQPRWCSVCTETSPVFPTPRRF